MPTRPDYPIHPERLPACPDLRSGHYIADFARSRAELEEVQRLRFRIFNLELGEGLDSSFATQMDADPFDDQCHHLIIRDTQNGDLVGTYRMQSREMADSARGFYSDTEYHLEQLPSELLDQSLELGRACISVEHRSGRVLFLLWRGLLYYLRRNNLRFMFGCCSVTSQDPEDGWALHTRLRRSGNLDANLIIPAREDYICPLTEINEEKVAGTVLPRLMSLYIDYGAQICSEPAIDREFKTIDFLALFDLEVIPPKLMKIFKQDVE